MSARKVPPRRRKPSVVELERKIALTAPTQKKNPVPFPYMPGTGYGLVRRSNLARRSPVA